MPWFSVESAQVTVEAVSRRSRQGPRRPCRAALSPPPAGLQSSLVRSVPARAASKARRVARRARPAWYVRRTRRGAFAIGHVGRSGSTVLGDMLGQHPHVHFDGETYGRHLYRVKQEAWAATDVLARLEFEMRTSGPGWFGFDYLPNYLSWTGLTPADHARGLRRLGFTHFVLLTRRNYLKQMVSMRAAMETRLWHDRGQVHERDHGTVRLPVQGRPGALGLATRIARVEEFYAETRRIHSGDRFLELSYEEHIESDPIRGYRRVVDFLGLEAYEPVVRLRRLSTSTVRERLQNFDEVAAALQGTPYAWMLDT